MFRRKKPERRSPPRSMRAPPSRRAAPELFEACGVPDTLDGRFDALALHASLMIDRLRREPDGEALAQAFFDAMFRHLDLTLREIGVQDLGVGRRIKIMAEGLHGRALAYREALAGGRRRLPRSCAATPMAVGRPPTTRRSAARGPCPRLRRCGLAGERRD